MRTYNLGKFKLEKYYNYLIMLILHG